MSDLIPDHLYSPDDLPPLTEEITDRYRNYESEMVLGLACEDQQPRWFIVTYHGIDVRAQDGTWKPLSPGHWDAVDGDFGFSKLIGWRELPPIPAQPGEKALGNPLLDTINSSLAESAMTYTDLIIRLTPVIHREGNMYVGWVQEVPGANAQAATGDELRRALEEAVMLIITSKT